MAGRSNFLRDGESASPRSSAIQLPVGVAIVAVAMVTLVCMAGASPAEAEQSRAGAEAMCPDVIKGSPSGGLVKETQPADGSEVQGGDVVKVTLRWDKARYDGESLHKALDCVTIDGELVPSLSVEERRTANDGVFEHSYTVPNGLPEGTRVCDRGFVSGRGPDGKFDREKSNDVCFVVGDQAPAAGEAAPAPAPPAPSPPAPVPPAPAPVPPPPSEEAPVTAGPAGGPAPPAVAAPAPAPARQLAETAPVSQPAAALPRTGSGGLLPVLISAAALLSGAFRIATRAGAKR